MSPDKPPHRCGAWPSPVTAAAVAAGGLRLSDIHVDGETILWIEGRPAEGGRCAVVRRDPDGRIEDVLPPPLSARSAVHEYGGGALETSSGAIYFTSQADQQIHRITPSGQPAPLTPPGPRRHADMAVVPGRGRLLAVVEEHRGGAVTNCIGSLGLTGGEPQMVVSGSDFHASPRPSPDGSRLAWLQWNQPLMPWDGTELWVADLPENGPATGARRVAGGEAEAILQPEWSPDGELHFLSDRTGWWNLHRWDGEAVHPVTSLEAECGRPMWVLGMSAYAFTGSGRIAVAAGRGGTWELLVVERETGTATPVALPFTELGRYVRATPAGVVLDAGGPACPMSVVAVDLDTGAHEIIRRSTSTPIPADRLSTFERVEFPTRDGGTGHGFLYRPRPGDIAVDAGERPPLLVRAHGGPTSAASTALDPAIQYWTTRGLAVLDVNYGGSTGYGRPYRERLLGAWGVVDVQDCVDAARHVAERGDADPARLLITGGSAGGYVVLCALAFHDAFAAGASHYGVADPEALARDTHKFEARYLDRLIGPHPERRDRYEERSPLRHIHGVTAPVILFQGREDAIVPLSQAETMWAALRDRGIPCALLVFEGEQHGFRREETIRRVLEAELSFYSQVLGFPPPEGMDPVSIAGGAALTSSEGREEGSR